MAVKGNYRVFYDDWQLQCCGEPFKVGGCVEWLVRMPMKMSVDVGHIDYRYEAHDSEAELFRLKGRVVKIQGLYEKFTPPYRLPDGTLTSEGFGGVLSELFAVNPRNEFLHSAVGWGRRDDDYEISAYVVELDDCSVEPLNGE